MSGMIYFSLFHFKILYYYQLIPHHSDGASLFFFAVYVKLFLVFFFYTFFSFLCRIIPTLCYNYLQVAGASIDNQIAYLNVMGSLRLGDLKILGSIFGAIADFFPLLILFIVLMTLISVIPFCKCCVNMKQLLFVDNPIVPPHSNEEGKRMIHNERKRFEEMLNEPAAAEKKSNSLSDAAKRLLSKYKKKNNKDKTVDEEPRENENNNYGSTLGSNSSFYNQEISRYNSASSMNGNTSLHSPKKSYQEWSNEI